MNTRSSSSLGGSSEYNEPTAQDAEVEVTAAAMEAEQMLMEYLLEMGFTWDEAMNLLDLRTHLYEGAEMRQRMEHDCRRQFARWLYENGELSEA